MGCDDFLSAKNMEICVIVGNQTVNDIPKFPLV